MKNKNSKMEQIILSVFELIVGIILFLKPASFTKTIIMILGVLLIISGVVSIINYFRTPPATAVLEKNLTKGLIATTFGLFCTFNSNWFIVTFPVITLLYGIMTLITGITKIEWTVDMVRLKIKGWYFIALSALLTIICAIVIICNPFSSTAILWTFIAITLIIEAVFDVVSALLVKE